MAIAKTSRSTQAGRSKKQVIANKPKPLGSASRAVIAEIDQKLSDLDAQLARYDKLLEERKRLRAARSALVSQGVNGRISQSQIASYLQEHPGSRAGQIAMALEVPLATISSHLYRGRRSRFVSREDGWHLREQEQA